MANNEVHVKLDIEKSAKFLDKVQKTIEMKDKIIDDLLTTIKRYAGFNERKIEGLPEERQNCEGYCWREKDGVYTHWYMDKFGAIESGNGPEIAIKALRDYNLMEQIK